MQYFHIHLYIYIQLIIGGNVSKLAKDAIESVEESLGVPDPEELSRQEAASALRSITSNLKESRAQEGLTVQDSETVNISNITLINNILFYILSIVY